MLWRVRLEEGYVQGLGFGLGSRQRFMAGVHG
jgi:hypothetical protein